MRSQALELTGCNGSDEDVLTYAMFPQVAAKFFTHRSEGPKNVGKSQPAKAPSGDGAPKAASGKAPVSSRVTYKVKVGEKSHQVTVEPA